ncbi:DUF1294 domain-containing protein [Hyphomonas sp.]|uniref:DUF1294 domain-containing protein n=1 Tax=Hyphomonas sp. TaxID=87 RepID=UPI00391B3476
MTTAPPPETASEKPASLRVRGRLINWSDERGFGFLAPDGGGQDVFVHASAFAKEGRHIEIGLEYEFTVDFGKDGRPKAKRVTRVVVAKAAPSLLSQIVQRGPRFLVIPAFLFIVLAIASVQPISENWFVIYGVASVACFAGYGLDKLAANQKAWRVSETILLLIGLVGGWPGGILGQEIFRHKTQKRSFRTLFWMSVAINMAAFVQINVFAAR